MPLIDLLLVYIGFKEVFRKRLRVLVQVYITLLLQDLLLFHLHLIDQNT